MLALNGQPVSDRADLSYLLTRDMINKPVPVTVLRNGRRMEFAAPVSLYRAPERSTARGPGADVSR